MNDITDKVLEIFYRADAIDSLQWHYDKKGAIQFYILVNDFFEQGVVDIENISTEQDFELLERAYHHLFFIEDSPTYFMPELFAFYKRGTVPHESIKFHNLELAELFKVIKSVTIISNG